jgi:hypothetical protein
VGLTSKACGLNELGLCAERARPVGLTSKACVLNE